MIQDFDRGKVPERVLAGLSKEGPLSLMRLYHFCGAKNGGDQYFVRQTVKQMVMDRRVRQQGMETYLLAEDAVVPKESSVISEPSTEPNAPDPPPTTESDERWLQSDASSFEETSEATPTRPKAKRGAVRDWILKKLSESSAPEFAIGDLAAQAVEAGVSASQDSVSQSISSMVKKGDLERAERGHVRLPTTVISPPPDIPSSGVPEIELVTEPPAQETETMQTQTQTQKSTKRTGTKNGRSTASGQSKPVSKTEWVITAVTDAGGIIAFAELWKRAQKEDIFTGQAGLGSALCSLTKQKRLKKVERGVYALPDAKVVYDPSKTGSKKAASAPTKRTADDVKRVALAKKTVKKTAKPGRKPSVLREVYDQIDQKIDENKADLKSATDGIRDIDRQMKDLTIKRAELVTQQNAAVARGKKLDVARERIGTVAAVISDSLKL